MTGPATVRRPATSNTLRANVIRGVNTAGGPIVARNTAGRSAPAATASTRRRRASKSSDQRCGASGPVVGAVTAGGVGSPGVGELREPGERGPAGVDVTLARLAGRGDALGEQRRGRREATRRLDLLDDRPRRVGQLGRCRSPRTTSRRPGRRPRRGATPSSRIDCVLRPMRRPSSVAASPRRWSWGSTVMASAPAMPAAKQATVERRAFTHGSYAVIIARDVTAWIGEVAPAAPTWSATRAHSRRTARIVAMVANWSPVAARRSSMRAMASAGAIPRPSRLAEVLDAGGDRGAELLGVGCPGVVEAGAVDGDDAQLRAVGAERRDPGGDGVEVFGDVDRRRVGGGDAERVGAQRAGLQGVRRWRRRPPASGPRRRAPRRRGRAAPRRAHRRPRRRRSSTGR